MSFGRYSIIQKQENKERCKCDNLKDVAKECFGFAMSNVSVYVFDNIEKREVKSFEYEKEIQEFIGYLSINRWL